MQLQTRYIFRSNLSTSFHSDLRNKACLIERRKGEYMERKREEGTEREGKTT